MSYLRLAHAVRLVFLVNIEDSHSPLSFIKLIDIYSQHNDAPSPGDAKLIQATINALSRRSCGENTTEILRNLRTLLVGVRQIPAEILTAILESVLVGETYRVPGLTDQAGKRNNAPGLMLERVCSRWRENVISSLTPHIQVNDSDLDEFAWRDACRLLKRKGASDAREDLCLTIDGHLGHRQSGIVDGLIRPYGSRIVELALTSSLHNLLAFLSLPPGTMPLLHVLRLVCLRAYSDPEEREIQPLHVLAPKLEEFVFEHAGTGSCFCHEFALSLQPRGVRRLNLSILDNRQAIVGFIKMLTESSSLASCIVRANPNLRARDFNTSSDNERTVLLSLGHLCLKFATTDGISFFLSHISCPSLWELQWSHSYTHAAAMEFLTRCGSNLTTLDFSHITLDGSQLRELLIGRKTLEKLSLGSITGLDTDALDGLEGAEILPNLHTFKWLDFDSAMILTATKFISARCPGSSERNGCSFLEHLTLNFAYRPARTVQEEFLRTLDGWRESGVKTGDESVYESKFAGGAIRQPIRAGRKGQQPDLRAQPLGSKNEVFAFEDAKAAFADLEAPGHVRKVVVEVAV
ncbi:hypothetical protein C8R46DRAFT_1271989 [Mycena filopes]|nr:hypothetical protein C8R46DRAFT_1271989 [Mycena filopes]